MNLKKDILRRVYLSYIFLIIFGLAIIVQIVRIQVIQGKYWSDLAQNLTTTFINIEPVRGNIYAADGSLMATSLPIYDIRMDLNADALTDEIFYANIDSLAIYLSRYFNDRSIIDYRSELINARKNGARYHLVKRRLSHTQIKDVMEFPLFRMGRFKGGVIVEQRSRRIKPFQLLAERTIGYSIPGVMPVGLEGAYDSYLSGVSGKRLMQRLSGGVWIPINDENELDPKNGQDIITTIDINIQDITEYSLLKELIRHNASHGCAIVMEVATGEIRAIANLAKGEDGEYREKFNYAIGESTEPGSTFKLASMMALLEQGYVKPEDSIETGDGQFRFFDRVMRDSREGGFGTITAHDAFAQSSNIAISRLVQTAYAGKPERFIDFLNNLNINQPLGIPITGEGKPLIKNPSDKNWSGITLPWMSIGYEVKFTPLQILTLFNAVANDGKMMKPLFVTEIRDVGKKVETFKPEVIKQKICSDRTLEQLQLMLEEVVETGTASNIKTSQYKIAGKTGTAQIALRSEGYSRTRAYQASFAGYFPADNPKYSCIVVIYSPSSGIFYGSWVAAPVFREIADKIFSYSPELVMPSTAIASNKIPNLSPAPYTNVQQIARLIKVDHTRDRKLINEWVKPHLVDSLLMFKKTFEDHKTVPDVRGMVLSDAVYLLENRGLSVKASGSGKVRVQSVLPGTEIIGKREIILTLN